MTTKLFIFILLFLCFQANATEFIINNLNEFETALSKSKAGDVIVWKDGNYVDIKINFKGNGTAEKPIVLKAQTAGKVSFSGNSQLLLSGNYLQVEGFLFEGKCTLEDKEHVISFAIGSKEAHHSKISNCAIINYTHAETTGKINYYVNLVGTYNEVQQCYFSGKTNKGPTLVVEYKQEKGYVPGSDVAASSHHHIDHNYFGYRTFSENGGEQIRVGTSTTSFSHGFNIIEYNYFEDERIETEVVSNKSWDNIYRFNTFIGNDGGMVIRHGQKCFVYGNYINGKAGRKESAGLRVINPNNTFFNNYVENLEGSDKDLKSPITVMSGLENSALNEYYPADNAIVAYNTIVNSVGAAIKIGVGNKNKGKLLVAPKNVLLVGNTVVNTVGKHIEPIVIEDPTSTYTLTDNFYTNGATSEKGFSQIKIKDLVLKDGFYFGRQLTDKSVIEAINQRLLVHQIKLSEKEIMVFDVSKIVFKKDVGVIWIKN
jgi:poly(beta-D-mannuronate) lyase